jgi:hypothetical protein
LRLAALGGCEMTTNSADQNRRDLRAGERQLAIRNAASITLGCLSKEGAIRSVLMPFILWPGTNAFLSLSILINTAALCAYDPLDRGSVGNARIFWITIATSIIFLLEILLKIVAFGFRGPGGFLRDPWNALDVVIVAVGFAEFSRYGSRVSGIRILRLLRPLQAFAGVRVVLDTFRRALPGMASVLALATMT